MAPFSPALLDNPEARALLPYLRPGLPSAQQVLLLAVACGWTDGEQQFLPGLRSTPRRRDAQQELEKLGHVRGGLAVPCPLPTEAEIASVFRPNKLRVSFELLLNPRGPLIARGLARLANALETHQVRALTAVLRDAEREAAADVAHRRHDKRGVLEHVGRRIPRDQVDPVTGARLNQVAPPNLVELTVQALVSGLERVPPDLPREVERLYQALSAHGEQYLWHWYEILIHTVAEESKPQRRYECWRHRLESMIRTHRLTMPGDLRLSHIDAREIKKRYPVPRLGFGPWVAAEQELWDRFREHWWPVWGPATRAMWHAAHDAVSAHLSGAAVDENVYEDLLWQTAERFSGLSRSALLALEHGSSSDEIYAARQEYNRVHKGRAQRALISRALRHAADDVVARGGRTGLDDLSPDFPPIDLDDSSYDTWGHRYLALVARRAAGERIAQGAFDRVLRDSKTARTSKPRRARTPSLGYRARRRLAFGLEKDPIVAVSLDDVDALADLKDRVRACLDWTAREARGGRGDEADAWGALREMLDHRPLVFLTDGSSGDGPGAQVRIRDAFPKHAPLIHRLIPLDGTETGIPTPQSVRPPARWRSPSRHPVHGASGPPLRQLRKA